MPMSIIELKKQKGQLFLCSAWENKNEKKNNRKISWYMHEALHSKWWKQKSLEKENLLLFIGDKIGSMCFQMNF